MILFFPVVSITQSQFTKNDEMKPENTNTRYRGPGKICFLLLTLLCFHFGTANGQINTKLKTDSGRSIPDTLLFKLQKAQAAITEVDAANEKGFGSAEVRADLVTVQQNTAPIKRDLKSPRRVIDPKTLISYNLILKDAQDKLNTWQQTLTKASSDLQRRSKEVIALSNDTLLSVKTDNNTSKTLYTRQLLDTKLRLQRAGKSNSASLDTVSRLLAAVSAAYLDITGLQANISQRLEASGKSLLREESPYLWAAEKDGDNLSGLVISSYAGQNKILGYFISSTWDTRIVLISFGVIFFLWIHFNLRKANRPDLKEKIGKLELSHISGIPVIPALIVMLNLVPLFEPDAPSLYIELITFIQIILLTVLFWPRLLKNELNYWAVIAALYLIIIMTNAAVHGALLMRLWLIVLNLCSLYVGFRFYRKLQQVKLHRKFIQPVTVIYFVFNLLAIVLNIFGRISLAKTYSLTAIIGLIQVISLAVFIQICTNALELQIKISSCNGGLFTRINIDKARASFQRALSVVAVILWLLVLLINMSISGGVFAFLHQVLVKPRTFGSVTFTLSNVLFFAVILYVSNILQKHIGILFGEKSVSFENQIEHKSSKLTLIRLVIAVFGLLLAVTASGIPLDKLTVVLGALSVGIGLGMQNIVNNFVSGIILIFEKPFQIGDFIELADRKGKIQDIGIRSSKMLTPQGSQVIIPNADLISNRFVNWTVNVAYTKSEILLKVNLAVDLATVMKIISEEITELKHTVKNMPPDIFINSVVADAVELKVLAWITSVYIEPDFKSQLYSRLIGRFAKEQIKLM
jgi:potassium efflux system protein